MFKSRCPNCGVVRNIDDSNRGKAAHCPCGARFVLEPITEAMEARAEPTEQPAEEPVCSKHEQAPAHPAAPPLVPTAKPDVSRKVVVIVCAVGVGAFLFGFLFGALTFGHGGGRGTFGGGPTTEGFKKAMHWGGIRNAMQLVKKDLLARVGEPDKTDESGDDIRLYYKCSDGVVILVVNRTMWEGDVAFVKDLVVTR